MFWLYLLSLLNSSIVSAFSFTHDPPTQCGDLNLQWSGGSPPFQLLVIPQFSVPRNISIPASAFTDGKGTFSTPLQLKETSKFILTMSDSTGFGSGGSTDLLVVGAANEATSTCDLSLPQLGFTYDAKDGLQQCRPFEFSSYQSAIQPITIMGVIPGGQSFVLNPPMGSTSFDWTANIYNGTTVIFLMIDSLSRQGGSLDFYTVLASGDTSCINSTSPSSTINPTSTSPTSFPTSKTDSNPSPSATPTGTPKAVIAATVIGALIFLAVGITLGLFFLKRFRDRKNTWNPNSYHRDSVRVRSQHGALDLNENDGPTTPSFYPSPLSAGAQSSYALFSPFSQSDSQSLAPFASSASPAYAPSHSTFSNVDPFSPMATMTDPDPFTSREPSRDTMSSAQRKAAMAGETSYKPARFILHTDIEDTGPDTEEDEVVELPPQYTERRTNAPGPSTLNQGAHSPLS